MNGRCETDTLDRAVDVCDSCYGEFCKGCLVLPKGRRHPICTHCTLALSGVRGHATVQVRGDKRTAKQRRAELAAAAAGPSEDKVFRYFDADGEPSAPDPESSGGARGGRRAGRRDRRTQAAPRGPGRGLEPGAAPLPMPDEVAAAAAALKAAAAGPAAVDPADPTQLVTVTRAVARLEELRRQGKTPAAGSPVPPVPPTAGAEASAGPAGIAAAAVPPGADDAVAPTEPAATAKAGPPPKPKAAPTPRDRRRPDVADREGRPPTAPMVGEIRTIGGRRRSDQAPPPQPARHRPASAPTAPQEHVAPSDAGIEDDDLVSVGEAISGVERFDARHPSTPTTAETGGARKADTDSQGNWIPPILRGMAPDARKAKTNLPQRKRGS